MAMHENNLMQHNLKSLIFLKFYLFHFVWFQVKFQESKNLNNILWRHIPGTMIYAFLYTLREY